jgi:hypothetical protein
MTYVIVNLNTDTPPTNELLNPSTPFRVKPLHLHHLLQERPFDLVIGPFQNLVLVKLHPISSYEVDG